MKRRLLRMANGLVKPLGVQFYRSGMDMESVIGQIGRRDGAIGTVLDIGASDGKWSRAAMRHLRDSRFIAVDPLSERENMLRRLKKENSRFDYILCAAGEKDSDTVSLSVADDLDGSTVGGNWGSKRVVATHSIDHIVTIMNCVGPYLLKFDTHGFEVPILKGAERTLGQTHYIVMEVYNYRHTPGTLLFYEMCDLLDSLGFRCFNIADPMHRPLDGAFWQMDLFFARKGHDFFRENSYSGV